MNIVVFSVLFLLLATAGYKYYIKRFRSGESENEFFTSISATQLFDDFENDEENSNKKYLGKVLAITGVVSAELTNQHDEPVVFLKTSSPLYGVSCTMKNNMKIEIQLGTNVTIKGTCNGYLSDVTIANGIFFREDTLAPEK